MSEEENEDVKELSDNLEELLSSYRSALHSLGIFTVFLMNFDQNERQ